MKTQVYRVTAENAVVWFTIDRFENIEVKTYRFDNLPDERLSFYSVSDLMEYLYHFWYCDRSNALHWELPCYYSIDSNNIPWDEYNIDFYKDTKQTDITKEIAKMIKELI